ncbi:MAG: hypothetical protein WBA17_07620 [Saprospiraceae bacterium]
MQLLSRFSFLLIAVAAPLLSFAQDGGLDIDIDLTEDKWYENYYFWLGVAAVIIIVALITRRKK